jgi:predicted ATPase
VRVSEFEAELAKRAPNAFGRWHKVDLHNHSPSSRDYQGDILTAAEASATAINESGLSIVMFTDHGMLPDQDFITAVRKRTNALVLSGVELNIFVDAWGAPKEKVGKNAFFHLLIGFDPDERATYWLEHIYRACGREERDCGTEKIVGVTQDVARVLDELADCKCIVIPAHLHSAPNAWRSRSIDDIYDDPRFLDVAGRFSALEITSPKTASFFDGKHAETRNLEKTCIRSSDAHHPSKLGTRVTWMQLQSPSFAELRAALELPFRISIEKPIEPASYVSGVHIDGAYLRDMWLAFSPHCNVLIGVKGSGKTAVLECLRFALGTEVPRASADQVRAHLAHVLGPTGSVTALIRREDGSRVLVQRRVAADAEFELTFSDDRVVKVTRSEAVGFPASVLGWHEIEHAAVDSGIRRQYMDAIAGREKIKQLEAEALARAEEIRFKHEQAASRYKSFKDLQRQTDEHEQLRRGLEELRDARLIELRDSYDMANSHRDELERVAAQLSALSEQAEARAADTLKIDQPAFAGASPLDAAVTPVRQAVQALVTAAASFGADMKRSAAAALSTLDAQRATVRDQYAAFVVSYEAAVSGLSDEQRRLLGAHQKILEQTQMLPALRAQRDLVKGELLELLRELAALCDGVTKRLDERSRLRQEAVAQFSTLVADSGVKLEVRTRVQTEDHQTYEARYRDGSRAWGELRNGPGERSTMHRALKASYEASAEDLMAGDRLYFSTPEFSHYITLFENDDLAVSFDPQGTGSGYRPIDQLSAGQRCTAFFPILLRLQQGPLVVDQPEDNLDNRHIASRIAPILLGDKRSRQIILTSHNANLVVLSDPECIFVFEGTGADGRLVAQGFLATRGSDVARPVLDILDGGERALDLRYQKYGRGNPGRR